MTVKPWQKVHEDIDRTPIIAGWIAGASVYVERYLYQAHAVSSGGIECAVLITHLGGGTVRNSGGNNQRLVPTQAILVPPKIATHWDYSGSIDFAIFYLMEGGAFAQALTMLSMTREVSQHFNDMLVSASARQIVYELQKGSGADDCFLGRLTSVMLEQSYRVLTTMTDGGINPQHAHYSRLQAALNHIHSHLDEDLSLCVLATKAGISTAHFRRIFQDATGMAPHRYVLAVRLERAIMLLSMSALPLAQIATECGFSSQSHFTASFRMTYDLTPMQYRGHLLDVATSIPRS